MKPIEKIFKSAVPHEAGHVLAAYCFGVGVRQIAYKIWSGFGGRIVSEIARPSRSLHEISPKEREAYCIIAAAGMAGEVITTGEYDRANLDPQSADRIILADVSSADIADFLAHAEVAIKRNRQAYDDLCMAMRERYPTVREQIISSGRPGTYTLLAANELNSILVGVK